MTSQILFSASSLGLGFSCLEVTIIYKRSFTSLPSASDIENEQRSSKVAARAAAFASEKHTHIISLCHDQTEANLHDEQRQRPKTTLIVASMVSEGLFRKETS